MRNEASGFCKLLLVLVASACQSAEAAPNGEPKDANTLVQLSRTVCYGECPIYSVAIRGDGWVFFYGNEYTGTRGYAERRIEPSKVRDLLAFMSKRKFRSLPRIVPPRATDHPSAITALRVGTLVHKIEHDLSNREIPALFEIEHEIDKVAGTEQWISMQAAPPGRPLGTVELRTMSGAAIGRVERQCATNPHGEVTVSGRLDEEGRLQPSSIAGQTVRSTKCVSGALANVAFPLVNVRNVELELSL
jgi:hypothetical protein